jgi:peptidoglycan/xylan/chitin deacetylase (PgdA/CDA1 family)
MLTRLLRKTLALPSGWPGYLPAVRRLRARSAAIVMYHGVTASPLPAFNWCQLPAQRFAEQIRFLAREYHILPVREVVRRLADGRPLPDRAVALTFDDGFRNVLTTAFPVLKRFQAPATVFLVTGLVGTNQPAWPDRLFHALVTTRHAEVFFEGRAWPLGTARERAVAYRYLADRLKVVDAQTKDDMLERLIEETGGEARVGPESPLATMDWDEAAQLAKSGLVEFGSHTHNHPILSRCPPEVQRQELRRSRDLLRERLGAADLFAYPNGGRRDFTPVTKWLLAELGYACGLTTAPGLNVPGADPYELRRVNVGADMTLADFERAMVGL